MRELPCPYCHSTVSIADLAERYENADPVICNHCFKEFLPSPLADTGHTTEFPKFLGEVIAALIPTQPKDNSEKAAKFFLPRDRRFSLKVMSGLDVGRVHVVSKAVMTIGRDTDVDILIHDKGISRHHARLEVAGTHVWLEDLSTANGSYVNGARISRAQLIPNGTFTLGATRIHLHQEDFF